MSPDGFCVAVILPGSEAAKDLTRKDMAKRLKVRPQALLQKWS